ncbi:hypothetical protein DEO72_LG3g852 [Vigna unguiculata]|uniref:Uncharacterized protein n=1 Tax=Vigna unguiculata TaxID=3917 RepID=A0A4D6LCL7_VIGUN|nr:hypothetical protein DEO72_LG3g852 [Vigna unguiculata]
MEQKITFRGLELCLRGGRMHYKLGGKEELTETLVELCVLEVRGRRGTISGKRQNERVRAGNEILGHLMDWP